MYALGHDNGVSLKQKEINDLKDKQEKDFNDFALQHTKKLGTSLNENVKLRNELGNLFNTVNSWKDKAPRYDRQNLKCTESYDWFNERVALKERKGFAIRSEILGREASFDTEEITCRKLTEIKKEVNG